MKEQEGSGVAAVSSYWHTNTKPLWSFPSELSAQLWFHLHTRTETQWKSPGHYPSVTSVVWISLLLYVQRSVWKKGSWENNHTWWDHQPNTMLKTRLSLISHQSVHTVLSSPTCPPPFFLPLCYLCSCSMHHKKTRCRGSNRSCIWTSGKEQWCLLWPASPEVEAWWPSCGRDGWLISYLCPTRGDSDVNQMGPLFHCRSTIWLVLLHLFFQTDNGVLERTKYLLFSWRHLI